MNWYKNIKLSAKRESIQFKGYNGMKTIDYLVNPSKGDIIGLLNKIGNNARGILIDGYLYVWDATQINHCDFCRAVSDRCKKYLQCYHGDESDLKGYGNDAMTFSLGPNGELRTNISQRDLATGYFKGKVKPYQDPQEHENNFDFHTHELI